ncbi:MAG: hypothetical protein WCT32_04485 [Patescibacteria group bacterium]
MTPVGEAGGPMDPSIIGDPSYTVNPDNQTSSPGKTVEVTADASKKTEANTDAEITAPVVEKRKTPERLRTERLGIAGELSKTIKERENRRSEEHWGKGRWGKFKEKLNTTDWGKAIKVAGKVALATTGVLAASTLSGGAGLLLAPLLYSQSLKLGFEGGLEGMQHLLRGRKERLGLEAKKQDFLKKSDERIAKVQAAENEFRIAKGKKDRGEINNEEYQKAVDQYSSQVESLTKSISRLESDYLKKEREYINLENSMKIQRATESTALSATFSLLMGMPLGVQGAGHNVIFAPGHGLHFIYKVGETMSSTGVHAIGTSLTHTVGAIATAASASRAYLGMGLAGAGLLATAGKEILNAKKNHQADKQERGTSLWAEVSNDLKAVGKKETVGQREAEAMAQEGSAETYEPPENLKKFAKKTAEHYKEIGRRTNEIDAEMSSLDEEEQRLKTDPTPTDQSRMRLEAIPAQREKLNNEKEELARETEKIKETAELYNLTVNIAGRITQRKNELNQLARDLSSPATIPLIEKAKAELADLYSLRKETWQKIAEKQRLIDEEAASAAASQTSEQPAQQESSPAPSEADFRKFYRENAAGFAEREKARATGQEPSEEYATFDNIYREIDRAENEMRQKEREINELQNRIDRGEVTATSQVREQLFGLTREYLDADRRRDNQKQLLREIYNQAKGAKSPRQTQATPENRTVTGDQPPILDNARSEGNKTSPELPKFESIDPAQIIRAARDPGVRARVISRLNGANSAESFGSLDGVTALEEAVILDELTNRARALMEDPRLSNATPEAAYDTVVLMLDQPEVEEEVGKEQTTTAEEVPGGQEKTPQPEEAETAEAARMDFVKRAFTDILSDTSYAPERINDVDELRLLFGDPLERGRMQSRKFYYEAYRQATVTLVTTPTRDISRYSAILRNLDEGYRKLLARVESDDRDGGSGSEKSPDEKDAEQGKPLEQGETAEPNAEIKQKFEEQLQKDKRIIAESTERAKGFEKYKNRLAGFCETSVAEITRESANIKDEPRRKAAELQAKMISRIPDSVGTKKFLSLMDQVSSPAELKPLDNDQIIAMEPGQAKQYADRISGQNHDIVRKYQELPTNITKSLTGTIGPLKTLAEVASSMHDSAKKSEGDDLEVMGRIAKTFEDSLGSNFDIQRIKVEPNQTPNYEKIEPFDIATTDDPTKNETVESIVSEGYMFNSELAGVPGGTIIKPAQAVIYKYQEAPARA